MGFRLATLDEVIANANSGAEGEPSQTEIVIGFAYDIDLFHNASGTAYADIDVRGHRETWNVARKNSLIDSISGFSKRRIKP